MLQSFIATNREEILAKSLARVALRDEPLAATAELIHGLPIFLDQLGDALGRAALNQVVDHEALHNSASTQGGQLFRAGLTVAQVVNSYGDLCQVISGLAADQHALITARDFQTLNLCLDDATAGAVTAYVSEHDLSAALKETEQVGMVAHEMRNALNVAVMAFASMRAGTVGTGGSTGAMLLRAFTRLGTLIDRSLAEVRLDAGLQDIRRVPVWEIIEEVEISSSMVAKASGLRFEVTSVDPNIVVEADRPALSAALANLVQNAFKFTRPSSTVKLRVTTTTSRVLIGVEDECGGLPPGSEQGLLQPFVQRGRNRTGLGLGLSICARAVKMMNGELRIQDLPGRGCIFTVDLPKQAPPPTSIHVHDVRPRDRQERPGEKMQRKP